MYYSINHVSRFSYSTPIRESVMELRMRPRNEGYQRPHSFEITTSPRAHIMNYRDFLGNIVDHFNIPGEHSRLTITMQTLVDVTVPPSLPDKLDSEAWERLEELMTQNNYWEMLNPSRFARPTPLLSQLAQEINLQRHDDPLTLLQELNSQLYQVMTYTPDKTRADSPIDEALESRAGVCQDYSHIMIALVRQLGIPCRYVSGYLFHQVEYDSTEGATHAWVEALLPDLGWIGFDPTNNVLARERHIRVAIGRDYADVPPTHGVFKGDTRSELAVAVKVELVDDPAPQDDLFEPVFQTISVEGLENDEPSSDNQQQQQQQ